MRGYCLVFTDEARRKAQYLSIYICNIDKFTLQFIYETIVGYF